MAKICTIRQAIFNEPHAKTLVRVLSEKDAHDARIASAFIRSHGVSALSEPLMSLGDKVTVYAGIRNQVTSAQALLSLLECGVKLYAVDMGARSPIFHPKITLVRSHDVAMCVIGSANLTHDGLYNNIEVGLELRLDLSSTDDANTCEAILDLLNRLEGWSTEHVYRIGDAAEVDALLERGFLEDELAERAPRPRSARTSDQDDSQTRMPNLDYTPPPRLSPPRIEESSFGESRESMPIQDGTGSAIKPESEDAVLVWQSRGLTERSLNVPRNENTHPTGDMNLTSGATIGIDHREYFRSTVFGELDWKADEAPDRAHIEYAEAQVSLIVANVHRGTFTLTLTHDVRTDTSSYMQNNAMTKLRWGNAKPVIARKELLGRTLNLYKKGGVPPTYIIEID